MLMQMKLHVNWSLRNRYLLLPFYEKLAKLWERKKVTPYIYICKQTQALNPSRCTSLSASGDKHPRFRKETEGESFSANARTAAFALRNFFWKYKLHSTVFINQMVLLFLTPPPPHYPFQASNGIVTASPEMWSQRTGNADFQDFKLKGHPAQPPLKQGRKHEWLPNKSTSAPSGGRPVPQGASLPPAPPLSHVTTTKHVKQEDQTLSNINLFLLKQQSHDFISSL